MRVKEWLENQPGLFEEIYRVTPSLRVGASAGVGVTEADPASPRETDRRGQPRLRLESIFRF